MALSDAGICTMSDLPDWMCGCKACRTDLVERRQPGDNEVVSKVTARFPGKCAACGDPTRVDDTICRTAAGDYICEGCAA